MNDFKHNGMQKKVSPQTSQLSHTVAVMFWMAPITLAIMVSGCSSCSEGSSSCKVNKDCGENQICINGKCIASSPGSDSVFDTTGSDSNSTSDTGTSAGSDSTSVGSDSTSDSLVCDEVGVIPNGLSCTDNCDCASQHCQNGFCCAGGECCGDAGDCGDNLCASATCQSGSCVYNTSPYVCGTEDVSGETCQDGYVCDGNRVCLPVTTASCGLYATTGNYACNALDAQLECYTSCTDANASTNCVTGAFCVGGACVSVLPAENGTVCTLDGDCISGHCGDGFCCATGECCATDANCSDECKATVVCGGNNQCFATNLGCGYEDTNGLDSCSGANRCNGQGACVAVSTCAEQGVWFGSSGDYTCDATSVTESCLTSCTSNTQCASGAQCEGGVCLVSNGGSCIDNGDCASAHCSNGICCTSGSCCTQSSDCSLPCQTNVACNTDIFQCASTGDPVACGEQDAVCTGSNRCDGVGHCAAVTDNCSGTTGMDSWSCNTGEVVRDCRCNVNSDCDLNTIFCDGTFLCGADSKCKFDTPVNACPAENACYTGVTCDETGKTCNGANPCDALADVCDTKQCVVDSVDTDTYSCEINPVADATPCNDSDECNGTDDRCMNGICESGPPDAAICFDSDPCTVDACDTDSLSCSNSVIAINGDCSIEYNCYGDNGTCQMNPLPPHKVECVPVESPCTNNGVCYTHTCSENFLTETATCSNEPNVAYVSIGCSDTNGVILTPNHFATRVYSDYTGPYDGDTDTTNDCQAPLNEPFIGKEAVIYIEPDTAADFTADLLIDTDASDAFGTLDFMLFQDANICNWSTCTARQPNGFVGIPLNSAQPSPEIIIDSRTDYFPPSNLKLILNCY